MLSIDADAHVIETEKTWDYPEGSDYGHADNASELLALKRLKENGDIDPVVIDKILCTNPARFLRPRLIPFLADKAARTND